MKFSNKNYNLVQQFGQQHSLINGMVSKTKLFTLALMLISFLSFSKQAYVPENNFGQALIDLGYDTVLDDYVTTANISGVISLNVSRNTDLTYLNCSSNQLSSLLFDNFKRSHQAM